MVESTDVKRVSNPSFDEFVEQTDHFRMPIIMTGIVDRWSVFRMFNFEMIKLKFGSATVTVRESDDEFDYFFGKGRKKEMRLNDYIKLISTPSETGQRHPYMGNLPFDHPNIAKFLSPLKPLFKFPRYIPSQKYGELRLWIGGKGQRSTIHNDNYHNLNAQIHGKKEFLLFSPDETEKLYVKELNQACWVSPVDPLHYDADEFPLFREAKAFRAVIAAGELLYIPIFWWHYVTALDTSISVSMFIHTDQPRYWSNSQI
ncbi:cupin-like domain-containing protein [Planktothrix sp. FACHB-1355]|uniref:cupin-like domain-containing protein n=1 Tax=Planktothrix sp. FACHB-1355 TaxID=2692854 RepID=UPI00168B276E|nr:cupin-like domain-containing protein [Planktothrix sp. FACHB-1355]MBD3557335.1 cupin-like domain-containing protein [Planktothrix sp. FACHB-1355]